MSGEPEKIVVVDYTGAEDLRKGIIYSRDWHVRREGCLHTLQAQRDRIEHFIQRIAERGMTGKDLVVLVINADDPRGRMWADDVMPGQDWQAHRDRGEIPMCRGLAGRSSVEAALVAEGFTTASIELKAIEDIAILVVDRGIVTAFDARVL